MYRAAAKMNVSGLYVIFTLIACVYMYIASAEDIDKTSVTTKVGTFVGYVYKSTSFDEDFSSRRFLGIPYAQPPVGNLRFQKPVRKEALEQPYDALEYKPVCIQQNEDLGGSRKPGIGENFRMSEDCLYLNVFTPNYPGTSNEKLPVMVFIHGGGFVIGSPHIFRGDVLASYGKVIFVTVAYRLSIWGFLSTGDMNMPGNYGLWDQQMAIQWVHDNIASFGGDPESITLIGKSAGAASVIYQSMFPGNIGLVKRGIANSGSITCPWAFTPEPLTATKRLAELVGCDVQVSTKELAECMKTKSTEELSATLDDKNNKFIRFPMEFLPVVDHDFLPETPWRLFHSDSDESKQYRDTLSKIDLMTGIVSGEGLMMITSFVGVYNTMTFEADRATFEYKLVPEILRVVFGNNLPDLARHLVAHEYTNWSDPDNNSNSRESFINLSGDYVFNIQAIDTASLHSGISGKNTYVYLYDALLSQHLMEHPAWSNKPQHVDDVATLLGYDVKDGFITWTTPYPFITPEEWEKDLTKAHMTMWSNFAKSGNPNEPIDVTSYIKTTWPKYDIQSQWYLNISRQMSENSVGQRLFARATNFWYTVMPALLDETKLSTRSAGFCEREGECAP